MNIVQRTVQVFVACIPAAAFAQTSYQCTSGTLVRRVEIAYEGSGAVPCEVQYVKETEAPGSRETLWNAANESGYCEARAQAFVARLQELGWQCSQQESAGVADDSAALAPATDPQ